MAINQSDKIKALRNGLAISAIMAFSTAPSTSNAQSSTLSETKSKHIAAVPQHDGEDDLLTLSPEDFQIFNPTGHEATIQDFKKIAHLTDFSDDFKKNPEAYGKSGKLIFGKYMLIAKSNIEEASTFSFDFKKEGLAQLSEQDYKSICAAKNINIAMRKLIALYALGKTDQADKILPDFSKKFADKIHISNINVTLGGDNFPALREEIKNNFEKIYPGFIKDTQKYWEQNHNFDEPTIELKDNQFINIAETKIYDVSDFKSRELAASKRKEYYDFINNLQANQKTLSDREKRQTLQSGKNIAKKDAPVTQRTNLKKTLPLKNIHETTR